MQSRQELKVVPADYRLENSEPLDSKAGAAREKTSVAGARSDDIGQIIDHLQVLSLRQSERDRAAEAQSQQQTALLLRMVEKLDGGKDRTALPNWLMPLICTAFIGLIVWIFNSSIQSMSKENEKLERRLETQETYMKDTREKLIAHGWTVDERGILLPPPLAPRK